MMELSLGVQISSRVHQTQCPCLAWHLRAKHIKERKNRGRPCARELPLPIKKADDPCAGFTARPTNEMPLLCSLFSLGADSFGYTRCPCMDLLPHSFPKPTITHAHPELLPDASSPFPYGSGRISSSLRGCSACTHPYGVFWLGH